MSALIPGSQNDCIIRYLKRGKTLTHFSAARLFNCLRLAARCYELRGMGYPIESHIIELSNGKKIAKYRLGRAG